MKGSGWHLFLRGGMCLAVVALLLACALGATATPAAPETPTAAHLESDVPYAPGGSPDQTLDIYTPPEEAASPRPVMIFVHGGDPDASS